MKFTLDVIISIYHKTNKVDLLNSLISVTKKQTIKPNNVIIVCDGPGCDEITNYIKQQYDDAVCVLFYSYKENKGPGFARDYAIRKSKSDLIAIMDSDDISKNYRFELQLKEFALNKNLSLCGGFIEEFDFSSTSPIKTIRTVPLEHHDILRQVKIKSPFNNVTVMFKRKSYLETGGYPYKRTSEDYSLWGRFLHFGFITKNIDSCLVSVNFDQSLLNRRTGISFLKDDFTTQKELMSLGIISKPLFMRNIALYFSFRLSPKPLIKLLYCQVLRS